MYVSSSKELQVVCKAPGGCQSFQPPHSLSRLITGPFLVPGKDKDDK